MEDEGDGIAWLDSQRPTLTVMDTGDVVRVTFGMEFTLDAISVSLVPFVVVCRRARGFIVGSVLVFALNACAPPVCFDHTLQWKSMTTSGCE